MTFPKAKQLLRHTKGEMYMIDTTNCTPEMKPIIESFNESLARLDAIEEILNTPGISREEANRRVAELGFDYDDDDDDCDEDDYDDEDEEYDY